MASTETYILCTSICLHRYLKWLEVFLKGKRERVYGDKRDTYKHNQVIYQFDKPNCRFLVVRTSFFRQKNNPYLRYTQPNKPALFLYLFRHKNVFLQKEYKNREKAFIFSFFSKSNFPILSVFLGILHKKRDLSPTKSLPERTISAPRSRANNRKKCPK